jgi:hypothetical protein
MSVPIPEWSVGSPEPARPMKSHGSSAASLAQLGEDLFDRDVFLPLRRLRRRAAELA